MKLTQLFVLLTVGLFAQASFAEFKIAVIDMQQTLSQVKQGKSAQAKLKKEVESVQKDLQKKRDAFQKKVADFKKQALILGDKARQQKERELQEEMVKLQQEASQSQMKFQNRDKELSQPIVKNIQEIVEAYSKEKGYALVIGSNEAGVIYVNDKDNITDEVIKRYDSKFKK